MRPVILTRTTVGSSVAVLNYRQQDFKVGFGVTKTGTINYTVQHTFDDPSATYSTDWSTDAQWFNNDDATLVAAITSQDGNYAFPVRGTKLLVNSGTGSVTMTILQG